MQARQALADKEQGNLKASMRAKRQGKVGKMNLDYQRLHDAFFRFQTKPLNMSLFGQVYAHIYFVLMNYEGILRDVSLKRN